MILALLLAVSAFGQSTGTVIPLADELREQNTAAAVRELQSGRPTITGVPYFPNGIRFPNGVQRSSPTAGSSGSDFSGSTVTIGVAGTVYTSTIAYEGVVKGGWATVLYTSFTAASAVHFYQFNSSYTHRVTLNYMQNTSNGDLLGRFQGDSGAVYYWNASGMENNVAFSNTGVSADTKAVLTLTDPLANTPIFATVEVYCPGAGQSICYMRGRTTYNNAGGAARESPSDINSLSGHKNSGSITTFNFLASAGTMTGYATVEVFVPAIYP